MRQEVNLFSSGKRIPGCELVLQWCKDPPPACLQCEIGLLGARDHSYFLLHVNPGKCTVMDCNVNFVTSMMVLAINTDAEISTNTQLIGELGFAHYKYVECHKIYCTYTVLDSCMIEHEHTA